MKGLARSTAMLLRTMWLWVLGPVVVVGVLVWSAAASIQDMYPDEQHRQVYADTVTHAAVAVRVLQGRGYDLTDVGGIFAQEMAVVVLFLFSLLGAYLGIRFTRWLEDKNYLDIITAGPIDRLAPTVAGAVCGALTCLLAAAVSFTALLVTGFGVRGSALWSAALLLFLVWGMTLGVMTSQLFRGSAEASYAAFGVVVGFYLFRGVVDVRSWNLVWSTPLSWFAETRPFADRPPAWPYLAYAAAIIVQMALALAFASRRDLGGGMFAASPGPPGARRTLAGPQTLLVRLVRGPIVALLLVAATVAFTFGLFASDMATDGLDQRTVLLVQIDAVLATSAGVLVSTAFSREEMSGRTGRALTGLSSRRRWQAGGVVVTLAASAAALLLLGCLSGLGLSLSLDDWNRFGEGLRAHAQHLSAVLLIPAVSLALGSFIPRLSSLAWVFVAWAAVVALRADMLQLSEWLRRLSPLEWTGKVPMDAWSLPAAAGMSGVVVMLVAVSLLAFPRRDLVRG